MAEPPGDCEAALRELWTYLDRELDGEVLAEVQGHLDGCLDCLQAFDFHAELRQVIARKCSDELPPGLVGRIRRCLGEAVAGGPAPGTRPAGETPAGDGVAR